MVHRRLVYIYLLNVPSFSSRYFNKIKRASRLGRLLALSLEILCKKHNITKGLHCIWQTVQVLSRTIEQLFPHIASLIIFPGLSTTKENG